MTEVIQRRQRALVCGGCFGAGRVMKLLDTPAEIAVLAKALPNSFPHTAKVICPDCKGSGFPARNGPIGVAP